MTSKLINIIGRRKESLIGHVLRRNHVLRNMLKDRMKGRRTTGMKRVMISNMLKVN